MALTKLRLQNIIIDAYQDAYESLLDIKSNLALDVLISKNIAVPQVQGYHDPESFIRYVYEDYGRDIQRTVYGYAMMKIVREIAQHIHNASIVEGTSLLDIEADGCTNLVYVSGSEKNNIIKKDIKIIPRTLKLYREEIDPDTRFIWGFVRGSGTKELPNNTLSMSGGDFWEFISGNREMGTLIMNITELDAKKFRKKYERYNEEIVQNLVEEFTERFCYRQKGKTLIDFSVVNNTHVGLELD